MVRPWGCYGVTQFRGQWLLRRGNLSSWLTLELQLMASNHDRPLDYFDSLFVTGKQVQTCSERKDGVSFKVLERELHNTDFSLNSAQSAGVLVPDSF